MHACVYARAYEYHHLRLYRIFSEHGRAQQKKPLFFFFEQSALYKNSKFF